MNPSRGVYFIGILLFLVCCKKGKQYLDEKEEGLVTESLRDAYYYQADLNRQFSDPSESPLKGKDLKRFKELSFFALNEEFRIVAHLRRSPDSTPFWMPTTTGRRSRERIYGILTFELSGQARQLEVYQEVDSLNQPVLADHLFLPFTDLTNGESSYPGGRYLDLKIPDSDTLILDFNKAYNPYCAYNSKYSCPLVPGQNRLGVAVRAGVRYPESWQK